VSISDFVGRVAASDFAALQADDGRRWVEALPHLVSQICESWGLAPDGDDFRHGFHAVVLPVTAAGTRCVLKVSWPASSIAEEELALTAWAGRGAVQVLRSDVARGVLLLERLDATTSLMSLPIFTAASEAARLLKAMSIAAPSGVRTAAEDAEAIRARLRASGGLIDISMINVGLSLLDVLSDGAEAALVHGDLHYENVLRGERSPWLAVDPKPVVGDPERGIAELLFTRVDELGNDATVRDLLRVVIDAGKLDATRAAAWAFVRTVDYWVWAAANGLTVDPRRCERVAIALKPLLR
jgi:streptomycin 6-kinase